MSQITDLNVRQSLYTWLQSSAIAEDFKPGSPDRFDPNREDTQEWVFIKVKKLQKKASTSAATEYFDITISAEVQSRDQSAALGVSNMAQKVTNALSLARIPVYDYATSGDPQVGLISLHENTSQEKDSKPWTMISISISGVVQSLA